MYAMMKRDEAVDSDALPNVDVRAFRWGVEMIEEGTGEGLDSLIECEHGSSFELIIKTAYLVKW